jgi:hypothetical protein
MEKEKMKVYFSIGQHYRELSPREGDRKYRFILLEDTACPLPRPVPNASFHDASGRVWMIHEGNWRFIKKGYAWNGCSPKRWIPGLGWVGTMDTERNVWGSLNHDAGYQFSGTKHFSLTREEEDALFKLNLEIFNFRLASLYHRTVRGFGAAYWGNNPDGLFSRAL